MWPFKKKEVCQKGSPKKEEKCCCHAEAPVAKEEACKPVPAKAPQAAPVAKKPESSAK